MLEGEGRLRINEWLVVGSPPENANTLEMTEEELAARYPDGPKALPPELGSGRFQG